MEDSIAIVLYVTKCVFLFTSILLLYVFLTPKRLFGFQAIAFIVTWISIYLLRIPLQPLHLDPLLLGYTTGALYLIPCILIFKETLQAKIFVFFTIYSLSQFTCLIFMHIDQFLSPPIPRTWALIGILLELACVSLIRRYLKPSIRNIIAIISKQNPSFTLFPIISFLLLTFYGMQRTYLLSTSIPLILSITLIFFSYYLIAIATDQTRRGEQLDLTSRTDSLTGLYNRRHMEEKIEEEYERYQRIGSEFAFIIADIDFFKNFNDLYGHDCGDYVLKSLSKDLQKSIREYDTVARWGGEEFLLLLPVTNGENAMALAERIRNTVEEREYLYENKALSVTITLGISIISRGDTIANSLKKADIALYQGKQAGRNCVISFDGIGSATISGIS